MHKPILVCKCGYPNFCRGSKTTTYEVSRNKSRSITHLLTWCTPGYPLSFHSICQSCCNPPAMLLWNVHISAVQLMMTKPCAGLQGLISQDTKTAPSQMRRLAGRGQHAAAELEHEFPSRETADIHLRGPGIASHTPILQLITSMIVSCHGWWYHFPPIGVHRQIDWYTKCDNEK